MRASADVDSAQAQRRAAVAALDSWRFKGRVAVSNGADGGSAQIEWQQSGNTAAITLRAPVSAQIWKLSGSDTRGWKLEGTRAGGTSGDDAESLLLRETGWRLPVAALSRWLFGLAHAESDRIEQRDNGLPARLIASDGWTVEYVQYDEALSPPLPIRIRADRAPHKLRLAIAEWRLE